MHDLCLQAILRQSTLSLLFPHFRYFFLTLFSDPVIDLSGKHGERALEGCFSLFLRRKRRILRVFPPLIDNPLAFVLFFYPHLFFLPHSKHLPRFQTKNPKNL